MCISVQHSQNFCSARIVRSSCCGNSLHTAYCTRSGQLFHHLSARCAVSRCSASSGTSSTKLLTHCCSRSCSVGCNSGRGFGRWHKLCYRYHVGRCRLDLQRLWHESCTFRQFGSSNTCTCSSVATAYPRPSSCSFCVTCSNDARDSQAQRCVHRWVQAFATEHGVQHPLHRQQIQHMWLTTSMVFSTLLAFSCLPRAFSARWKRSTLRTAQQHGYRYVGACRPYSGSPAAAP